VEKDDLESGREQVDKSFVLLIGALERAIRTYELLGRSDRAESERAALRTVSNSLDEWRCRSVALTEVRFHRERAHHANLRAPVRVGAKGSEI
jgi:hypothetical protein